GPHPLPRRLRALQPRPPAPPHIAAALLPGHLPPDPPPPPRPRRLAPPPAPRLRAALPGPPGARAFPLPGSRRRAPGLLRLAPRRPLRRLALGAPVRAPPRWPPRRSQVHLRLRGVLARGRARPRL